MNGEHPGGHPEPGDFHIRDSIIEEILIIKHSRKWGSIHRYLDILSNLKADSMRRETLLHIDYAQQNEGQEQYYSTLWYH